MTADAHAPRRRRALLASLALGASLLAAPIAFGAAAGAASSLHPAGLGHTYGVRGGSIDGLPIVRTIHLTATAYGPSLKDNYPYGPVNAYGQPLYFGGVAVDPRVIPLGTRLYIKGYSDSYLPTGGFLAVADDTGGAIKGDRVDIFMPDNARTVSNFGIQKVTAYILGK